MNNSAWQNLQLTDWVGRMAAEQLACRAAVWQYPALLIGHNRPVPSALLPNATYDEPQNQAVARHAAEQSASTFQKVSALTSARDIEAGWIKPSRSTDNPAPPAAVIRECTGGERGQSLCRAGKPTRAKASSVIWQGWKPY